MASDGRNAPLPADAGAPSLNENHRRHLLASCVYVDRLLADIDTIVATADSASPFARYVNDLSPALARVVRDYLTRLRTDMLRVLEQHHAMPESPRISAVHAIRTALDTALARLEDQRFEVAVFGRVSAGKSSLLNHLMGQTVLPVGVTPITAIPTRVTYGATASVDVEFADRRAERVDLDRLGDFVTEQQNPANAKHVTRIVVHVPAPRLQEGIVFVDTPGLGSLATSGAAETLAYLPRCDLAVVLIDAASTLTEDDIATLHRLQQAAIPAMVVLSKADLVSADDRDRAVAYTSRQLSTERGTPVAVRAISTAAGSEGLLDAWIEDDLRPLLARHRELAHASVLRKIGALRASAEAALEARDRGRLIRGSTPSH
jgi:small GTP-binding protein